MCHLGAKSCDFAFPGAEEEVQSVEFLLTAVITGFGLSKCILSGCSWQSVSGCECH